MYENETMNLSDMAKFLGVGRNTMLRLCQERPHGIPVVRVGRRYQSELSKLSAWKDDWYAGMFEID